ncbi:23S rRNA (pseudouridine(1915)-N(3))-methyltransferase RlmH [Rhodobacteraceae bacterium D3-12]|nr:23S rRNA (pseudouridine(1915)-N(3))-methyltransferase RlmH [Rhodobacteraceae bacterium D3-12]
MRVTICAVGRLRSGPEKDLIGDYTTRFDRTGRALGLGPLTLTEVEDRKGGGMEAEAALLTRAMPGNATAIALDERGKLMTSPDFAQTLARLRDDGTSDLAFLIGGADGLSPDLRARATLSLSFGKMVWPHMLARVMLTEQLYRAASILAGAPYHRA